MVGTATAALRGGPMIESAIDTASFAMQIAFLTMEILR